MLDRPAHRQRQRRYRERQAAGRLIEYLPLAGLTGDILVELMVINLKTAKAIGLTVPANVTIPRGRDDRIGMLFCCGA